MEQFENELKWIKDEQIRNFVHYELEKIPTYFFLVAASSTGKYHPPYALGEGGLYRHTKAAVTLAHDMLGLEMYKKFTDEDHDLILAALMLHDAYKHGEVESRYTIAEHPSVCANALKNSGYEQFLSEEQFVKLYSAIACHMGQWNTDYKTKREILPKPSTAMEKFVHQCDYLASRKYIEINFEAINYEGDRV